MNTHALGSENEDIAENYLTAKGYTILERNFHVGKSGEIDIICRDGNILVFVEVKSRRSYEYGTPEDAVTPSKRDTIRRTAQRYVHIHNANNCECRFDVIALDYVSGNPEIRHWVHAFD